MISLGRPESDACGQETRDEGRKLTVTTVRSKTVIVTEQYVCRINASRHIVVRALAEGQVAAVLVKEGQAVKKGDLPFQVGPPSPGERPGAEELARMVPIKATFDGLIGTLSGQAGGLVKEGDPLTTLSDDGEMRWVEKVWAGKRCRRVHPVPGTDFAAIDYSVYYGQNHQVFHVDLDILSR